MSAGSCSNKARNRVGRGVSPWGRSSSSATARICTSVMMRIVHAEIARLEEAAGSRPGAVAVRGIAAGIRGTLRIVGCGRHPRGLFTRKVRSHTEADLMTAPRGLRLMPRRVRCSLSSFVSHPLNANSPRASPSCHAPIVGASAGGCPRATGGPRRGPALDDPRGEGARDPGRRVRATIGPFSHPLDRSPPRSASGRKTRWSSRRRRPAAKIRRMQVRAERIVVSPDPALALKRTVARRSPTPSTGPASRQASSTSRSPRRLRLNIAPPRQRPRRSKRRALGGGTPSSCPWCPAAGGRRPPFSQRSLTCWVPSRPTCLILYLPIMWSWASSRALTPRSGAVTTWRSSPPPRASR